MKKRFIAVLLVSVLLAGCGSKDVVNKAAAPAIEKNEKTEVVVSPEKATKEVMEETTTVVENEEATEEDITSEPNVTENSENTSVSDVENAEIAENVEPIKDENTCISIEEKTMYANNNVNIRILPNTDCEILGLLNYGEAITVNGYAESGWYRVVFEDNEAYISSKMLQDTKPITEIAVEAESKDSGYTDTLCVGLAKEIFDATNAERIAAGIDPLIWDDRLADPANIRAQEIITNFSHVRTDGTKCYALSDLIWGENIARGPHATGAEFLEHWMSSDGHKANILNSQYKTMGVGFTCTEQGDTAVQLFGK